MESTDRQQIIIYSDSQAAINAISTQRTKSSLVAECISNLNQLASLTPVKIQWTKAHVGTTGNETADWLAKQGAKQRIIGPEPGLPVAAGLCKTSTIAWAKEQYKRRWTGMNSCRLTRDFFESPLGDSDTRKLLNLSRRRLRLIIQILTGHGNIGTHLVKMRKRSDDHCRKCEVARETGTHIFEDCPAYARHRRNILGENIPDLKHTVATRKFCRLSRYLEAIGRLEEHDVN
jgi:hypothetical protein